MGGNQLGFVDYEQTIVRKRTTRRKRFLDEVEALEPWNALIDLIETSLTLGAPGGR